MNNYDQLPPAYGISIISFSLCFFIFLNHQLKTNIKIRKKPELVNVESQPLLNNSSDNFQNNQSSIHLNNNASNDSKVRERMKVFTKEGGYYVLENIKNDSNNHSSNFSSKKTKKLKEDNSIGTWMWRNVFISWIHALFVGIWDLSCFYYYPDLVDDLVSFNNLYIYSLVAFSTGYFIYDTLEILLSRKMGLIVDVVPHHLAVISTFFYNVIGSFCVSYCVVALLTEVNTVFLHTRKLLQIHGFPFDHWLYRCNSALNLITFVCCRFTSLVWIVMGVYIDQDRLPLVYKLLLASALFIMSVTNILLFFRLIKSDVIRALSATKKAKVDVVVADEKLNIVGGGVGGGSGGVVGGGVEGRGKDVEGFVSRDMDVAGFGLENKNGKENEGD